MTAPAVLVVGGSRGIGLEFVRQYRGEGTRVIATFRATADAEPLRALGARPLALDVRDPAAITALPQQLAGEPLRLAIFNAGVFGPRTQNLVAPDAADFDTVMHTNVLAAMRLIPALASFLAATHGTLAVVSSRMGSMALMQSTSGWLYRASKAALNSVVKSASIELGAQGIVCVALHPGWVRTDMGGAAAEIDAADSVAGMRRVLAAVDSSMNGGFFNFDGERLPW
jgi:NAD(P)-dependent dehydrogenase (short-subunit alcohol dehydrogenase family)